MSKITAHRLPTWLLPIYFAFLGAGFATMLRVAWLYVSPPVFETRAKLVAGVRMGGSVTHHPQFWEMMQTTLNTVKEALQSPDMARRTADRVHALFPETPPCEVTLRVLQTNGSAILNLIVTGPEPKYIQHYLNALMDEFIAVRTAWSEEAANKIVAPFLKVVVNEQKKVEEALDAVEDAKRQVESVSAKIEVERLSELLKRLRNERDDLKQTRSEKLPAVETEIQGIERELLKHEEAASMLRKAQERYELHRKAYQELFEQAEHLWNTDQVMDYIHIQERASQGSKQPVLSLSSIGYFYPGLGLLAGALAGLWCASRRSLESLG
ncbi:MAG: hypothetical protein ACK5TH_09605 [Prosthecobacter sp.]|jgi:hypothetical protein